MHRQNATTTGVSATFHIHSYRCKDRGTGLTGTSGKPGTGYSDSRKVGIDDDLGEHASEGESLSRERISMLFFENEKTDPLTACVAKTAAISASVLGTAAGAAALATMRRTEAMVTSISRVMKAR